MTTEHVQTRSNVLEVSKISYETTGFNQAMKDYQEGNVVDLDVALNEKPNEQNES